MKIDFDPDWTIAPGETLRDWCEENNLPHAAAATACGRMPLDVFEAIIAGKRRITRTIAEALHHGTGVPASLWLNLERRYRADLKAGRKDTTTGLQAMTPALQRQQPSSPSPVPPSGESRTPCADGPRTLPSPGCAGPSLQETEQ